MKLLFMLLLLLSMITTLPPRFCPTLSSACTKLSHSCSIPQYKFIYVHVASTLHAFPWLFIKLCSHLTSLLHRRLFIVYFAATTLSSLIIIIIFSSCHRSFSSCMGDRAFSVVPSFKTCLFSMDLPE